MNTNSQFHKTNTFNIKMALKSYPIILKVISVISLLPILAAPIVFFLSVFVFDDPNANIFAQFGIFLGVNSYSFVLVGIYVLSLFIYTKYQKWIVAILPFAGLFLLVYGLVWFFNDGPVSKDSVSPIDYRLFRDTPAEALATAVQRENIKGIEIILKDNPALGDYKEPKYHQAVIFQAIANKKYKSLEAMLQSGANPNVVAHEKASEPNRPDTPLGYVCGKFSYSDEECLKFFKLLLQYGADINSENLILNGKEWSASSTPLSAASGNGHMKVVNYLLANGADIDAAGLQNFQPLKAAIVHRHYDVAMELLIQGANPDYRPDDNQRTVRELLEASIIDQSNSLPGDITEMKNLLQYIKAQDNQRKI